MCVQRAISVGFSPQAPDGQWDGPSGCLGVHVGVVAGREDLDHGRVIRIATGELQGELLSQVCSVDGPQPWSDPGKAKILLSPDIIRVISSCLPSCSWGPGW